MISSRAVYLQMMSNCGQWHVVTRAGYDVPARVKLPAQRTEFLYFKPQPPALQGMLLRWWASVAPFMKKFLLNATVYIRDSRTQWNPPKNPTELILANPIYIPGSFIRHFGVGYQERSDLESWKNSWSATHVHDNTVFFFHRYLLFPVSRHLSSHSVHCRSHHHHHQDRSQSIHCSYIELAHTEETT